MRETEAEVYVNGDRGGSSAGGGANDSGDDDDEEERKLSIVQELPELTTSPILMSPMSLAMYRARERSQGEPRRDSEQVTDFPRPR